MIKRLIMSDELIEVKHKYSKILSGFDPNEWIKDQRNVALTNAVGDISLFQRLLPSVVIGHYFYISRGRAALDVATEMLKEIFTGPYDVEVIEGLSPLGKLGARWLNRKLGFKSHGVVDTVSGPCEIVIMTKNEWRQLHG
jgi:hypothetical protein